MSDDTTPKQMTGPARHRGVLFAAVVGSAALHAALVFGPNPIAQDPNDQTVAVVPVHLLGPEPVATPEPETVQETEPAATEPPEPAPEPEPIAEAAPAPAPEPKRAPTTPPAPPATSPPNPTPPPTPTPTSPQPPAPQVAAATTAADAAADTAPGSFAGNAKGRRGPSLRINWGSPAAALERIERGGLQLAVLGTTGGTRITHAVQLSANGSAQRSAPPALNRFDAEARIVGDAPAFAHAAHALNLAPGEHLVILLPRALADQARLAQRTFIRRQGHQWEDIAVTTAVLDPARHGLRARVTGLHPVQ